MKGGHMKTNPILGKLLVDFLDLNGLCNKTNDPSGGGADAAHCSRHRQHLARMGNPSAEAFSSFGDNARLGSIAPRRSAWNRPTWCRTNPRNSPRSPTARGGTDTTHEKLGPGRREYHRTDDVRRAFYETWQEASQERGETFGEFWPRYKLSNGESPNRETAHKWRNYVSKKKAAGLWD